jgi:hypothetical protein
MRALRTKANRLQLLQAQFESLVQKGYKKEVYGELNIFILINENQVYLKVFRGTSTNPIVYTSFSNIDRLEAKVKDLKASHDRSKSYKEELKNNPIKSCAANCATAIREELKKYFPNVKFSVKSSNFAGGDSVGVTWSDGPTTEQIESITKKYAYGRFDSMQDLSYSVYNDKLPQAKYVQTRREVSENINKVVFEALRKVFSDDTTDYEINNYKYRIIEKTPIPVGSVITGLKETKISGAIEDAFSLEFNLSEVIESKTEVIKSEFEKVEVPEGEIQIIDYSERSIALIGDTRPIKDKLKEIGGKFNARLSCGAGWIFPKTKLEEIQKLFSA